MQLNGGLFRGIRSVRAFWFALLAILVGLLFVGLGIYFYITDQNKTYAEATATITDIKSEMIGEDESYYVIISYTDINGDYHADIRFDAYDSSWSVGKEITIKYNVDNTDEVRTNTPTFILPLAFIALGGLSAVVGVVIVIKTIKRAKRRPNQNTENSQTNSEQVNNVSDIELFFHFAGKLNQSYKVEDKQGNVVFECKLTKFNLIGAHKYDFVDVKTGYTKQLSIGKTNTSSSSDGLPLVGDVISSGFKIDGVNCWDYIADMGYEIKHYLQGKALFRYQVVKNDKVVANIIPANYKDPFNKDNMNYIRMPKGCFRLEIDNGDLFDIVLMAFIISRTDIVE